MKPTQFILIDDDVDSNKLFRLYVKHALPQVKVVDFNEPESGFLYIETAFDNAGSEPAILFLDINMATMTGWEFLEKFDGLNVQIKNQFTVYMISSSIDLRDQDKAALNKYVKGYFEKPMEISFLKKLYEKHV